MLRKRECSESLKRRSRTLSCASELSTVNDIECLDWKTAPFSELKQSLADDVFWGEYLRDLAPHCSTDYAIHLAVFVEPYLRFIFERRKTVESRFGAVRQAPFRQVKPGDVVLLKQSGGPVVGVCRIQRAWFYEIRPESWSEIRDRFSEMMCATDPSFWDRRLQAKYATLMRISRAREIEPVRWKKRDRRGWVVVKKRGVTMEQRTFDG